MSTQWITNRNPGIEELEACLAGGWHQKTFFVTTDEGVVCECTFWMDRSAPDGEWKDQTDDYVEYAVIAWMPIPAPELPEPYRPGSTK